jgi:hypothetical protein
MNHGLQRTRTLQQSILLWAEHLTYGEPNHPLRIPMSSNQKPEDAHSMIWLGRSDRGSSPYSRLL